MRIERAPNQQPQNWKFADEALRRSAPAMFGYMAWLAWLRSKETGPWQDLPRPAENRVLRVALLLAQNHCGPVLKDRHDVRPSGLGPVYVDEELPEVLPAALMKALEEWVEVPPTQPPKKPVQVRELSFSNFIATFQQQIFARAEDKAAVAQKGLRQGHTFDRIEGLQAGLHAAVELVDQLGDSRFGYYKALSPTCLIPNYIGQLSRRLASTTGGGDQLTKAVSDLFSEFKDAVDALTISEAGTVPLSPNRLRDLKRFSVLLERVARWGALSSAGPELERLAPESPIIGEEYEDSLAVNRLMAWWCVRGATPHYQETLKALKSLVNWNLSWTAADLARLDELKKAWHDLDVLFKTEVRVKLQGYAAVASGELSMIRGVARDFPGSAPGRELELMCESLEAGLLEVKSFADAYPSLPKEGKFPLYAELRETLKPDNPRRPDKLVLATSQCVGFNGLFAALTKYQNLVKAAERLRQDALPGSPVPVNGSVLKTWLRLEGLRESLSQIVDAQLVDWDAVQQAIDSSEGALAKISVEGDGGYVDWGVRIPVLEKPKPKNVDATTRAASSVSNFDPLVPVLMQIEEPLWRAAILDKLRQSSDDAVDFTVQESFKTVMLSCGIGRLQSRGDDAGPCWAVWVPSTSNVENKMLVPLTPANLAEWLGYENQADFDAALAERWLAFSRAAVRAIRDSAAE